MPRALALSPTTSEGVPLYPVPLASEGVRLAFTGRDGGVSAGPYASLNLGTHVGDDPEAVATNRARLATALGVPEVAYLRQVHGSQLVTSDEPESEADLLEVLPGSAGAIMVADCVPLAFWHSTTDRLVLVHAGWRGLAGDALDVAVARLGTPEDLHVVVGPAIAGADYQVGEDVVAAHPSFHSHAVAYGTRFRLDLRAVAVTQLLALGLRDEHLRVVTASTGPDGPFFSDRAARPCGRFALTAVSRPSLSSKG